MHQTRAEPRNPHATEPGEGDQHQRGLLSQSDPEPERSAGRPPIWLIIIFVLLVSGLVVLHLAGVFGPGSH